ncbi:hypothetical protein A2160_01300 [Candidatus Beckwithbacteria bacterium RBG_13_42_9]|uniref:histidine kinase n=1 Tax=Candidatus Beckwithbacteria bacterium RBG_13_42_9 TaxID=1797457 RepID=A0A1F5E4E3_9BACT|nr:MAG: hypothetical protein A2160_01300 [Candidatus Beckwithbacteria bacterium RBG_13_42_9]
MFQKERLKLTFWYLLIIIIVSSLFSLFIYYGLTFELGRYARIETRIEGLPQPPPLVHFRLDPEVFDEIRRRIALRLILTDLVIWTLSGAAAYFLAGRTLKPIGEMLEEQKRFVADASHELRTPLTAIKTEVEVALRDKKLSPTNTKRLLQSNLEEVDKMQSLSDHLLALSQYQSRDRKLKKEKIILKEIVTEAWNKVAGLALQKQVKLETKVDDLEIMANRLSLTELLTILLDNSVKYSHQQGRIIVKAFEKGKNIFITVKDFGMGIKAGDLPYIFNRFYRADLSRTKTKIDGYGLGLSIAKSIADLHNGTVAAESTPGKGAKFQITLPNKS